MADVTKFIREYAYISHRFAANIRQIRGRYADQYTWIYGGYTADIRGYTANTRIREVRASSRKYAVGSPHSRQIRGSTRASSHEYARIRGHIHGSTMKYTKIRKDSRPIRRHSHRFTVTYPRMNLVTSALREARPLSSPTAAPSNLSGRHSRGTSPPCASKMQLPSQKTPRHTHTTG